MLQSAGCSAIMNYSAAGSPSCLNNCELSEIIFSLARGPRIHYSCTGGSLVCPRHAVGEHLSCALDPRGGSAFPVFGRVFSPAGSCLSV